MLIFPGRALACDELVIRSSGELLLADQLRQVGAGHNLELPRVLERDEQVLVDRVDETVRLSD